MNLFKMTSFAGALAAGTVALTATAENQQSRRNVIILFLDDVSAQDFGCYGVRDPKVANTLAIDNLAEKGAMFAKCWGAPLCSPSRAMMMTGRLPTRTDWWENKMKPKPNTDEGNFSINNLTANKIFHDNGYGTAFLGKWQLGGQPDNPSYGIDYALISGMGFGKSPYKNWVWPEEANMPGHASWEFSPTMWEWDSDAGTKKYLKTKDTDYGAEIEMDAIKSFIKKQVKNDKPFFVYWPTHVGHNAWSFLLDKKCQNSLPLHDEDGNPIYNADGTYKRSRATYKAHLEYADYQQAEIIRFLKKENLADNTILVFATDNGAKWFGKGSVLQQRGTHVPLIIKAPGIKPSPAPINALVSLIDITPTLVDLTGVKIPENYEFDGQSLKPLMTGEKDSLRDVTVSFMNVLNMARNDRYILDGWGSLWDTHGSADHSKFTDVSNNPELDPIKKKLKAVADKLLPLPSENEKYYKKFLKVKDKRHEKMKKTDVKFMSGEGKKYDDPGN